jgi:hypothetical protein
MHLTKKSDAYGFLFPVDFFCLYLYYKDNAQLPHSKIQQKS